MRTSSINNNNSAGLSVKMNANYLAEQKKSSDKELASEWTEIEELYTEK